MSQSDHVSDNARAAEGRLMVDCSRFTTAADTYIEGVRDSWHNVGIAVAVVRGKELIYARGFGPRQLGEVSPIGPDTLFQIGSMTKAITAAALGILVDERKLRWDDPISDHVPEFRMQDPWLTRIVTIRDALCHRSGITERTYLPALGIMNTDEAIQLLRYAPADLAFRDSYRYSNLMYAVLGKVLENVAGMSWNDWVRTRLLEPLNMQRSGTSPYEFWDAQFVAPTFLGSAPAGNVTIRDSHAKDLAMPHGWDTNGCPVVLAWQSYDNAAPAGSIVASVADMASWLIFNLNGGCFQGRQLLHQATLHELHAAQNPRVDVSQFPFSAGTEGYAMGWRRSHYHGSLYLAHGGGIIGSTAYVALLPQEQLGVVALTNGSELAREDLGSWRLGPNKAVAFWIFDRLLGLTPRDWSNEFLEKARAARGDCDQRETKLRRSRIAETRPQLPLHEYAGVYGDVPGYKGAVTVAVENNHLSLCFSGAGAYSAVLHHWHNDLFRVQSGAGVADLVGTTFASFAIDACGQIESMTIFGEKFRRLSIEHAVAHHG